MARKSRKTTNVKITGVINENHSQERKVFVTAIYARLSIENSGNSNNRESIENQIQICKDYLKKHPELKLYDIYKDNGETGTNFERPAFKRLIDDVKSGIVNCIVVKDLSRFGRNYIEAGEYIEKIFPFLGVRFIAITDGFDNKTSVNTETALMIPFKNMINDAYAKDISRKIISSLRAKQEQGDFLPAQPPYGYLKSKENNNYEIDPKTAPYVKMIFKWKVDGLSNLEISNKLNQINAITPTMRKIELGLKKQKGNEQHTWLRNNSTITRILRNPTYTGNLVYGRKIVSLCQGIKKHETSKEEWLLFPNRHEAIISQELFDNVQKIMDRSKQKINEKTANSHIERMQIQNLFHNKIYCGDCGRKMILVKRKNPYTKKYTYNYAHFECCGYSNRLCSSHYIQYLNIYKTVLCFIQSQLNIWTEQKTILNKNSSSKKKLSCDLKDIEMQLEKLNQKRSYLFENFAEGILDEKEYLFVKEKYDLQVIEVQKQLQTITEKNKEVEDVLSKRNPWLIALNNIENITDLNQDIIDMMINKIKIYENLTIEIELNYKEEKAIFEKILNRLMEE